MSRVMVPPRGHQYRLHATTCSDRDDSLRDDIVDAKIVVKVPLASAAPNGHPEPIAQPSPLVFGGQFQPMRPFGRKEIDGGVDRCRTRGSGTTDRTGPSLPVSPRAALVPWIRCSSLQEHALSDLPPSPSLRSAVPTRPVLGRGWRSRRRTVAIEIDPTEAEPQIRGAQDSCGNPESRHLFARVMMVHPSHLYSHLTTPVLWE